MKRASYEVNRLVNYAKKASADEMMEDYGVEIIENGKVFDTVEEKTFQTIIEWAESVVGNDDETEYNYGLKRSRSKEEDEYY